MSTSDARPAAVISGAGSGVGREVALALGKRGHPLLLLGRRTDRLRETLAASGAPGLALACDVRSEAAIRAALGLAEAEGWRPGIVFPAAGVARVGRLEELAPEALLETVEVNLIGTLQLFAACLPTLRAERRGHLFALLSVAATRGFDGWSAYGASKWGLRGAVAALREELSGSGVLLTAIYPGAMDTELWSGVPGSWNRAAMMAAIRIAEAVVWSLEMSGAVVEEIHLQPEGGNL